MLSRLQGSRTDKFTSAFIAFVGGLACLDAPTYPSGVVSGFDQVQAGVFSQVLGSIIVPNLPDVPAYQQRQALTGMARLAQDPSMWVAPLAALVPSLVASLVQTASQIPPLPEGEGETFSMLDLEEGGFQASFAKLSAAAPPLRLTDLASPYLVQAGTNSVEGYVQLALQHIRTNAPAEIQAAVA